LHKNLIINGEAYTKFEGKMQGKETIMNCMGDGHGKIKRA
jgi:hypothetical protein